MRRDVQGDGKDLPFMTRRDQYLKVREVADELGFKVPTIYGWLNTGKLKGCRIGGRAIRITRSELERFKAVEITDY